MQKPSILPRQKRSLQIYQIQLKCPKSGYGEKSLSTVTAGDIRLSFHRFGQRK